MTELAPKSDNRSCKVTHLCINIHNTCAHAVTGKLAIHPARTICYYSGLNNVMSYHTLPRVVFYISGRRWSKLSMIFCSTVGSYFENNYVVDLSKVIISMKLNISKNLSQYEQEM